MADAIDRVVSGEVPLRHDEIAQLRMIREDAGIDNA